MGIHDTEAQLPSRSFQRSANLSASLQVNITPQFFDFLQRSMLMTSTYVLICVTVAYKKTEKTEASCLHEFQECYSSWLGTVLLEHDQAAPRIQ